MEEELDGVDRDDIVNLKDLLTLYCAKNEVISSAQKMNKSLMENF